MPAPPDRPRRRAPSIYAILFGLIALAILATWIVPAGRFTTVRYDADQSVLILDDGTIPRTLPAVQTTLDRLGVRTPIGAMTDGTASKPLAVPGTYRRMAATPLSPLAILTAPIEGTIEGADIVLFILVIGGFIALFNRSGAFDAGLATLGRRLRDREPWLIVVLILLFGLGGTTFGMAEETIAFYPLLAPLLLAAGYDRIVPLAIILGGSQLGAMAALTNPFATIIASATIGARWTDGIGVRSTMWVIAMALLIGWTLFYAARVRRDPARSLVPVDQAPPATAELHAIAPVMTARIRMLLVQFAATFAVMIFGVSRLGWWFPEMSALFLGSAILAGLLQSGDGRVEAFLRGAGDLLGVALVVGMARGVSHVLADGRIEVTLVAASANMVAGAPPALFLVGTAALLALVCFVNSSTSSVAVLTMPLLGPAAAAIGVAGSSVVTAYLFGQGLMQLVTPVGIVLPSLAMMRVPYGAWLRFVLPLVGVLALVATVLLVASA